MRKLFAVALAAGVFCPHGQSADDPKVQAIRTTSGGEKSAESPPCYDADIVEVLRKDLGTGTPLQKQRALEAIMALGAIRLLPDVMKAIEDPTPLPRDGDTGWGFVGHEAATAMARFAEMIDGVDLKQRGYRAYSFHDDSGDGGAALKASGRLAEVRRNWEQWRRDSVQFSTAIGGDFSNLDTCNINYSPYRKDETNAARIGAILSDALEKEATTSGDGPRRQKAKTEIIFSVPTASISWVTSAGGLGNPRMVTDFVIATDFAGWKLVSPGKSEIEKSETLQHLVISKRQPEIDALFQMERLHQRSNSLRRNAIQRGNQGSRSANAARAKPPIRE